MDNLELSDKEKKEIIEDYTGIVKDLQSKILRYQNLINKFKASLNNNPDSTILKGAIDEIVSNAVVHRVHNQEDGKKEKIPTQNWKHISLNALRELNSFSTTNEIYTFLINQSPEFINYDKGEVVSKISTALSNLYSKNAIQRVKNTIGRGYFWALPAWYSPELIGVYKARLCKKYSVMESTFFPIPPPPPPLIPPMPPMPPMPVVPKKVI